MPDVAKTTRVVSRAMSARRQSSGAKSPYSNPSWREVMTAQPPERIVIGPCFVQIHADFVRLPGAEGWIGAWAIYMSLPDTDTLPVRLGSTDVMATSDLAHGTARAIATAVARSLG